MNMFVYIYRERETQLLMVDILTLVSYDVFLTRKVRFKYTQERDAC